METSLPDDIALKIVSTLQASDVFSLGNCSRFWRELCALDCVWAALCRDRWPALELDKESCAPEIETHQLDQHMESTFKGWRGFYISKRNEMAVKAAVVVDFVERCLSYESIEVGHYLAAIQELCSMQFGFKDVQTFFLKPKLHVLLNLVGLHYCMAWLGVPAEHVKEALDSCKISDRQICVQWWKLGRWLNGFRMRDESHSHNVSLGDLARSEDEEVLGVLHRGAIHEVLRVQISATKPTYIPWSYQSAQVL